MAANLTTFIDALKNGGARPNQFEVSIIAPGGVLGLLAATTNFRFLAKATTVPSFTIGEIPVAYRGRQVFVSGDRTYDTWSVTVMAEQDLHFMKAFVFWSDLITGVGNEAESATGADYYGQAVITQLDRKGTMKNVWLLEDIWPTAVGGIDFAWDSNDTIAEYTVDFRFNHMTFDGIGL